MDSFEELLSKIQHKDKVKATTTLKFKKDVIDILLECPFEGDILEVGTSSGNTTAVLATVAKQLGKQVYGFDHSVEQVRNADKLCSSLGLDNYKIIEKDVYNEEWDLENIGFVLIDCIHTEKNLRMDIQNAIGVSINQNPIIVIHDYGLVTKKGDKVIDFIKSSEDLKVVKYIGEEKDWNALGSGTVIDWEGVQLEVIS